jgi:hypothetical protein
MFEYVATYQHCLLFPLIVFSFVIVLAGAGKGERAAGKNAAISLHRGG